MRTIDQNNSPVLRTIVALGCVLGLTAWNASAQTTHTVRLHAAPLTKSVTLPNGSTVSVQMWGFGLDAEVAGEDLNGNGITDPAQPVTVPGPRITVPPGTTDLQIHLRNALTQADGVTPLPGAEPISLVIPGQPFTAAPVRDAGGRIVSMTAEAAPGGPAQVYTFTGVKPGTFLYQSGTHQAIQVQMGLYGAMTMDAAAADATAVPPIAAQAYAGTSYDSEALLLYSEIDLALHQAVAAGTFGAAGGPSSTLGYAPTLFLINGQSYANELSPVVEAGSAGQRTLLRLLNAGLKTHVPVLENGALSLVAEDGNALPFARDRAAILLSAGKTHDAIWAPALGGVYSLWDRSLNLTAESQSSAGMLAKLHVGGSTGTSGSATAVADAYTVLEDNPLNIPNTSPGSGVLGNDTGAASAVILTSPMSGALTRFGTNGTFRYVPATNFTGVDSFTYQAVAGDGTRSDPATVAITVTRVDDAPIANPQQLGVDARASIPVALTGTDADGDPLTFYVTVNPNNTTVGLPPVRRGTLSIIDPATHIERPLVAADLYTGPGTGTPIPAGHLIFSASTATTPAPLYGNARFWFLVTSSSGTTVTASVARPVDVNVFAPELTAAAGVPLTLTVQGVDGTPIANYRWTLEEDRMYEVIPGVADANTSSVSFHASYMPVVQSGDETAAPLVDYTPDPTTGDVKRYFISVLPETGPYTNGGAQVASGQTAVTVKVNKGPQPFAQIRVRVFNDNAGTNGVWDSTEAGLPGFEVTVFDAGGRYGMSGGQMLTDAYGNQIGTEYCDNPSAGCTDPTEVVTPGKGFVLTDGDGYALIKNLPPGKFTIFVKQPGGENWVQTSTIEGTPGIDAWVKNNEPTYFSEFGPPGPHVEVGYVQATNTLGSGPNRTALIGRVTNMRMSRPPDPRLYSGAPYDFTTPWVALNAGATGTALLYSAPVNDDGTFRIANVPAGSYQLVVFDTALDLIISSQVINVAPPAGSTTVAAETQLGDVPVFQWFTRLYNYVFEDAPDQSGFPNGFRDGGEAGIPEQAINIRWRDGSMYQSSATDGSGFVPFEEVFPFFSWMIAEVDYTRYRATGVTVVVDNGGAVSTTNTWASLVGAELDPAVLSPQPQGLADGAPSEGAPYRTETGPVLLEAFQGFIGQSNVLLWGKAPYAPIGSVLPDVNAAPFDEFPGAGDTDANGNGAFDMDLFHGGITGIVHYSITRAENDPRWGTAEPWEPGIPTVRVQLWDKKRTTMLNEVTTDSWDASQPTGCRGEVFTFLGRATDCYDGLRNFNQVRPGVFDGGFAFYTQKEPFVNATGGIMPVASRTTERPLAPGEYVVKVIVPNGYTLVKEEDKNVDFGEEYVPPQFYLAGFEFGDPGLTDAQPGVTVEEYPLYAPFCVGALHDVPDQLALFPGVLGAYGGDTRPTCDAKLVNLRAGQNAAANFFLFTEAPIAGHIHGFVLDDTTNEFDPNAPTFGEKYAPPFMPVAIKDWTGREIIRTYTDAYGVYDVLVPSTYTAAAPIPSGMSPSMLTACINAPMMPNPDGSGTEVPDPHFHKEYSHFCYTMQFMPGTTSYLDTPVLPTGAFTGNGTFPVDAELPNQTPIILSANNPTLNIGPYVVDDTAALRTIVIRAPGDPADGLVPVPNPAYDGAGGTRPKLIRRDYGFGPADPGGFVTLGGRRINILSWSPLEITARVPANTLADPDWRTGELAVERCLTPKSGGDCADKRKSVLGVTLTVATTTMHTRKPPIVVAPGQKIQAAIDGAAVGDLILVRPGAYQEMVVVNKPVRLQGWGALSTIINVVSTPAENLQAWRDYVGTMLTQHPDLLLPDQANIIGPPPFAEGAITAGIGGEGAGFFVFGSSNDAFNSDNGRCGWSPFNPPVNAPFCLMNENAGGTPAVFRANGRIDGFSISGASQAAGIMVNAFARSLEISNNKILNNYGYFAGGIRVGQVGAPLPLVDEDAQNNNVFIHNNMIVQNAGIGADGGGGIVLGTGTACPGDNPAQTFCNYEVSGNFIAGNFTAGQGAGISHIGLSHGGLIDRNTIVFNESFNQGISVAGAGIFIGGRPAAAGALTPGAGTVRVFNNLIQGNQAAAGDGGGIALIGVNGVNARDVRYRVNMFNNMIANNTAALAGAGISIQDAAYVDIVHNTIVNNDSLATAGAAFTWVNGRPSDCPATTTSSVCSAPQPAGIVSRGYTPLLAAELGRAWNAPDIVNSIVWHNRSFHFGPTAGGIILPTDPAAISYGLIPNATQPFWDLGLLGATGQFAPVSSVLTSTAGIGGSGNTTAAPNFVASYVNTDRRTAYAMPDIYNPMQAPAAFDEGGNFIRPQFGPLSLETLGTVARPFWGNYHVNTGVAGSNLNSLYPGGVPNRLQTDFDMQARSLTNPHRGADQKTGAASPVTPVP